MGNIQKRTKEPEGRTERPARQTASFHELLHCIFMGLSRAVSLDPYGDLSQAPRARDGGDHSDSCRGEDT